MNLGDMRGLLREYINEPSPVFWTDAKLNDYINVGVRKCHALIKSMSRYHFTTRATFNTIAGTEYYNLPNNLKDLRLVTVLTPESVEVPMRMLYMPTPFPWAPSFGTDIHSEPPCNYMLVGRTIRIAPVPSGVHTIRLYYEARLVDLVSDDNTPTFEEDYHDMAVKWAAIEARIKDRQQSTDLSAVFEERKNDLILDLFHRLPNPYTEVESYQQD
jgi:hypothetical protein